ncbi:MAG: glycosyltransferase family 39 protein [Solirubrobacteraceae bacterium]
MTTATPPRPVNPIFELPEIVDVRAPRWFDRIDRRVSAAVICVLLMAVSAFIRTRTLSGELWSNEAGAVGLASHSLGSLLGAVHRAGAAPLYYLMLHAWISLFGSSETSTHGLSLLLGVLSVPAAMWAGWSTAGRRAGIFAAVLFAFGSFLTRYAEETQPYELMVLLGLLATAGLIHAFVHRRRGYLWLFGGCLALMLYTHGSALLYAVGAAAALVFVWRSSSSDAREGFLRDTALCFGGAAVAFLPWLPTAIDQIAHATNPWHYTPLMGATVPSQLLGSERVDVTLLICVVIAVAPLCARGRRRTPEAATLWALIAIPAVALAVGRIVGFFVPIWAWRYFAPIVAPLLLLGGVSAARARVVGPIAIVFCVAFLANAGSFAPAHKSDVKDVAAEMTPYLHPGDLVVVSQPEQAPLAWYYMPSGLRYATTLGPTSDPSVMNWMGALGRLQDANPRATLALLVASLKPGQQLLYVRPLTEGAKNWKATWAQLVRRRSAQWGQLLQDDRANGTLTPIATAPHNYRSACCVANSAVLYRKAS